LAFFGFLAFFGLFGLFFPKKSFVQMPLVPRRLVFTSEQQTEESSELVSPDDACVYCKDSRCPASRSHEPCVSCQVRVYPSVSEGDNKLANSFFRSLVLPPKVECCVCYDDLGPLDRVFVPPCHAAHAVCSKCLFTCMCKTGDLRDFYSCVMCRAMIRVPLTRATDFHKDRVTTKFWFTCLLASGADTEHVQTGADASFVPTFSRARAIRDVRAGKLGVCDASRLLGSPADDYHERAECAIPECFQCAALALFEPDCATRADGSEADATIGKNEPVEPHGTTPESVRVAALIHLTPGIEQRALVRYASKFAHCVDALTSLEAQSVESAESTDVEPEHRRALCAHLRRLRGVE
jgi:hypothetical protein